LHFVTRYQLKRAWSSQNALREAKARLIQLHLTKMTERNLNPGNTVGFGMNAEHARKVWEVFQGTMEQDNVGHLQMALTLSCLVHAADCMGLADPSFGFLEIGGLRVVFDALVMNESGCSVIKSLVDTMHLVVGFMKGTLQGDVKVRGVPTDQVDVTTKLVFMSSVFHHTNRQLNVVWPSTLKVVFYYKNLVDFNALSNNVIKEQYMRLRELSAEQLNNNNDDDDDDDETETEATATSIPPEFDALSSIIKSSASGEQEDHPTINVFEHMDAVVAPGLDYINNLVEELAGEGGDETDTYVTATSQED
jgi:hypothetical protein